MKRGKYLKMKRMYIFGSGASRCAGMPTIKNSIETILTEFNASFLLNKDDVKQKEDIEKFDRLKSAYQKFKKVVNWKGTYKIDDIEYFLIWLRNEEKDTKTESLSDIVSWYFWDKAYHVKTPKFHGLFLKEIFKEGDCIVSFNYDILLEKVLVNTLEKHDDLSTERKIVSKYVQRQL